MQTWTLTHSDKVNMQTSANEEKLLTVVVLVFKHYGSGLKQNWTYE